MNRMIQQIAKDQEATFKQHLHNQRISIGFDPQGWGHVLVFGGLCLIAMVVGVVMAWGMVIFVQSMVGR